VTRPAILVALLAFRLLAQQSASKYELPADQRTGTIHRVFVLCHSHLDIGFTRPPDEVARDYKDNIDTAIRLTRENTDFRWTIESTWMIEEWLRRTGDDALVAELGKMLRDGRMSLGMAFANMHSGLMAAEESNRLVYLGEKFRRKFGIHSAVALQNDVPGFTWAFPRIFAGSGVKRLITGLNLFIGGGNNLGVGKDPFYWIGPDGSRVLTYFTYDSYVEGSRWKLGGRYPIEELEQSVPRRLAWLEKNGYKYDTYLLMASPGDNVNPMGAFQILERIREWNGKHPELPMKMSTPEEFFDYLTAKYGDNFPSASGDSAGFWESVKLRAPEAAAKMRQVSNDLPAAEMAATIASLLAKVSFPKFDLGQAWRSLLTFHEHTADADEGWPGYFTRWDTDWNNIAHYSAALNGFSGTEQIFRRSITGIAAPEQVAWLPNPTAGNSSTATIVVYNALPWRRSGPVEAERLPVPLTAGGAGNQRRGYGRADAIRRCAWVDASHRLLGKRCALGGIPVVLDSKGGGIDSGRAGRIPAGRDVGQRGIDHCDSRPQRATADGAGRCRQAFWQAVPGEQEGRFPAARYRSGGSESHRWSCHQGHRDGAYGVVASAHGDHTLSRRALRRSAI